MAREGLAVMVVLVCEGGKSPMNEPIWGKGGNNL
jgi:hypothetical protein